MYMGGFIYESNRCLPKRENNKGDELERYLLLAINGRVETTML